MPCHHQQRRTVLGGGYLRPFGPGRQFSFSTSFLPNGHCRFFSLSHSFSPSLHGCTDRRRALGTYSASRIRDISLLGSFGIIYWSPMESASSRFFSPERRPKSDWARIQCDANFPADVIPAKLKERVMRRRDRWYTRTGDIILYKIQKSPLDTYTRISNNTRARNVWHFCCKTERRKKRKEYVNNNFNKFSNF